MVEKYKKIKENIFESKRKGEIMGVMIPLWYAVCLCFAAVYFGFWFGRSRNWGLIEKLQVEGATGNAGAETGRIGHDGRKTRPETGTGPEKGRPGPGMSGGKTRGTVLFCPTGGRATGCREGESSGVKIMTTESRLYSPASGRVLKISPRGNAFLIRTDWGGDVTVRACTNEDDLLDRYFRPRVVKGEIVRRGKLLLEYDRETLCRKCQDTAVYVTVGDGQEGELEIAEDLRVKVGDSIRWLQPEDPS